MAAMGADAALEELVEESVPAVMVLCEEIMYLAAASSNVLETRPRPPSLCRIKKVPGAAAPTFSGFRSGSITQRWRPESSSRGRTKSPAPFVSHGWTPT